MTPNILTLTKTKMPKQSEDRGSKMNLKTAKGGVAVVGLGYVGLPLALLATRKGYGVYGIDIQESRIGLLRERESPIKDPSIQKEIESASSERLCFTSDFRFVRDVKTIIICVPTPVKTNHHPDLGHVILAVREIGRNLKNDQLVILESTVNPGVSEEVVIPILESESGMKCGEDFYLAHCPERINPGDPKWNVENIPRVVGSIDRTGLERAVEFYSSILSAGIKPMRSIKEAEAVKIVENSFRDINIAFVNELAMSFSKLGIDAVNVIEGAATKPFAFMAHYPGCGVGGHCIPVDPYYLIEYAEKNGFHHEFLSLARRINNHMPEFTVEQLFQGLNEKRQAPNGLQVAVLGLSYKADIDDCRESPALEIIKILERSGVIVKMFDPYVPEKSNCSTIEDALRGSYAVVIATAHREFKELRPEDFRKKGIEVVVDGCNCLDKEAFPDEGIIYKGIGR